jgi:hypothetical protein
MEVWELVEDPSPAFCYTCKKEVDYEIYPINGLCFECGQCDRCCECCDYVLLLEEVEWNIWDEGILTPV